MLTLSILNQGHNCSVSLQMDITVGVDTVGKPDERDGKWTFCRYVLREQFETWQTHVLKSISHYVPNKKINLVVIMFPSFNF